MVLGRPFMAPLHLALAFRVRGCFVFPCFLARARRRSRFARGGFVCSNCWSAFGVGGNQKKRHLPDRITPNVRRKMRKRPEAARPSTGRFQTKLRPRLNRRPFTVFRFPNSVRPVFYPNYNIGSAYKVPPKLRLCGLPRTGCAWYNWTGQLSKIKKSEGWCVCVGIIVYIRYT